MGCLRLRSTTKADSKLLLARDRLGKKPLHYAIIDDRLLFGSEIKSLALGRA